MFQEYTFVLEFEASKRKLKIKKVDPLETVVSRVADLFKVAAENLTLQYFDHECDEYLDLTDVSELRETKRLKVERAVGAYHITCK